MCMAGSSSKIDLCTNFSYRDQILTFAPWHHSAGRCGVPFSMVVMTVSYLLTLNKVEWNLLHVHLQIESTDDFSFVLPSHICLCLQVKMGVIWTVAVCSLVEVANLLRALAASTLGQSLPWWWRQQVPLKHR
jgi:hypothetical protein